MEAQNSNDVRTVEIRSRPKMLTKTIASMTRDQKQVVKSMGFGGVLGLQLKSLSKDFVLFVIDQLDPVQMVIHTHNGDIPIDRLAVHEVYGFPMGHKKFISRNVTNYNSELGELWKEHTKKNFGLKQISERITKNTKCDRMFQLDFLILMSSLLISASKNNSCNREILATLPVDFVCQEYDWCEYVLRTVETCKEDLKKNLFCGPLVFLLLLYCDRVSIPLDPPVLRNRPVVAQWKNEDLQRRFQAESSGERFGLGLFLDEWKNTVEARDWRKQNVHFEECGCLSIEDDGHEMEDEKGLSIEDDGHEMEDEKGPSLQNTPSLENSHAAAATNLENSSLVEQFSELSVSLVGDAAGLSLSSPNAAGLSLSSPNAAGATVVADAYVCETQEDPVLCADEAVPIKCRTVDVTVGDAAIGEAQAAKPLKRSERQSKEVAGPLRRSERKKIPTKRYTPTSVVGQLTTFSIGDADVAGTSDAATATTSDAADLEKPAQIEGNVASKSNMSLESTHTSGSSHPEDKQQDNRDESDETPPLKTASCNKNDEVLESHAHQKRKKKTGVELNVNRVCDPESDNDSQETCSVFPALSPLGPSTSIRRSSSVEVNHTVNHQHDVIEDSGTYRETIGSWRGNDVGLEVKELLQAVEHHYPNTFQGVQIRPKPYWQSILKVLHVVIKGFLEASVDALAEEHISSLQEDPNDFEGLGFDLSWALKRLDMVKKLKFGNDSLRLELVALEESLEPLKGRLDKAQERLKKARLDYDSAKDARNKKLQEVAIKLGAEYDDVFKGHLGFGMLPGY